MHCADPGCMAACPADGAIVQYANGIVDFQSGKLYWLRVLRLWLSFRHSALQSGNEEGL